MSVRDAAQELIELGPRGTLFRVGWELRGRTGLTKTTVGAPALATRPVEWRTHLQMEDPIALARAMRPRMGEQRVERLRTIADEACHGRILCFGRWTADFGDPIRWHQSPVTTARWDPALPWYRALVADSVDDVKYTWEAARFPHAYHIARAATFFPARAEDYASALLAHLSGFIEANPAGFGIHWASGQEIGFRLLAWLFAYDVLLGRASQARSAEALISAALIEGARHIEEHLDYARIAVYNNHLLSEALALFAVGALMPEVDEASRWRTLGRRILDEEAERQFYRDGGYIQQSHNYHRVALLDYLWACTFARAMGDAPSDAWKDALERSLGFLSAHENPEDGRLPNYGSNDGSLPSILSTCDFSDMRPVLQATSVLVRGERLYPPGPWDEPTAWFLGVCALNAPLRPMSRHSVSFAGTGYHVLRGVDERNFAAFRCGTLHDRFSQIDMLHVDVWWRGENVLVDPGSFQYNGASRWHEHFVRTAAHNTMVVDGRDQMVHHRQFKVLYWTRAKLTRFEDAGNWAICSGEHYGFVRHRGACVHHRDVVFVKDDLWVVVDRIAGSGTHTARLHWLGGAFEWVPADEGNGMDLRTPAGVFCVRTYHASGIPAGGSVVAGSDDTPRGWLSRYYGEKVPVPSFAAEYRAPLPMTLVSVLSGTPVNATAHGDDWQFLSPQQAISIALASGKVSTVRVDS